MFKKGGFLDHLEGFLVGRGMFDLYKKKKAHSSLSNIL